MTKMGALAINDVVISKVAGGHELLVVDDSPTALTLLYRGNGWSPHYASARGAKLATRKGGALWYTNDGATHLEYLETFRVLRELRNVAGGPPLVQPAVT